MEKFVCKFTEATTNTMYRIIIKKRLHLQNYLIMLLYLFWKKEVGMN